MNETSATPHNDETSQVDARLRHRQPHRRLAQKPRLGALACLAFLAIELFGATAGARPTRAQQVPPTPTGSNDLGDFVWDDKDRDGIYDPGLEPGIPGVTVYISRVGTLGSYRAPVVTNNLGYYRFHDLACGVYTLRFERPLDKGTWRFTRKNAGYDRTKDSDANELGITDSIGSCPPTNSQVVDNLDVDAGMYDPSLGGVCAPGSGLTLGDTIWEDVDRDGIRDVGERGLKNVEVRLYVTGYEGREGTELVRGPTGLKTWTDLNGHYKFTCLTEGMYYIAIPDIPNYTTSTLPAPAYTNCDDDQNCGVGKRLHTGDEKFVSEWVWLTEPSAPPRFSDSPNMSLDGGFTCAGPTDVMLVIDKSHSIDDAVLHDAAAEAIKVVDSMKFPEQRVGLMTFARNTSLIPLQSSPAMTRAALVALASAETEPASDVAGAVRLTREHFASHGRPEAKKLMLIWSDAEQLGVPGDPVAEAELARGDNILIAGFWQPQIRPGDEPQPTPAQIATSRAVMESMVSSPSHFHENRFGGVQTLHALACPEYSGSLIAHLECPNGSNGLVSLSTGVADYFGVVLPGQAASGPATRDGTWHVRGPGQGSGPAMGATVRLDPPPVGWSQVEGARWIKPLVPAGPGLYRYEMSFDLPEIINEARLRLSLWANSEIDSLEINGHYVAIHHGSTFDPPHEYGTIDTSLLLEGQRNTLTVVVDSPGGDSALQVLGNLEVCAGALPLPPSPLTGPIPRIDAIHVQGQTAADLDPTTGSVTNFLADLTVPNGVTIDNCFYTGDGITEPGGLQAIRDPNGNVNARCRASKVFDPAPGPRPNSYGPKGLVLHVDYHVASTGAHGSISQPKAYKVFFRRDVADRGKTHKERPNWFDYWGDDGAIPDLTLPFVQYEPGAKDGPSGEYRAATDKVVLFDKAIQAQASFMPSHQPPQFEACSFYTPAVGVLGWAASIVRHEQEHRNVHHSWSGAWSGPDPDITPPPGSPIVQPWRDSDRNGTDNDSLPDHFEVFDLDSDPNDVDTCDLGQEGKPGWDVYAKIGDNEVVARRSQIMAGYVPPRDWAKPGSQTQAGDPAPTPGPGGSLMAAMNPMRPAKPDLDLAASLFGSLSDLVSPARPKAAAPVMVMGEGQDPSLNGSHDLVLQNDDGDALIDAIVLNVGIDSLGGRYAISATLRADDGTAFIGGWSSESTLPSGSQTVSIRFDGRAIRAAGADGPYTASRIELYKVTDLDTSPLIDSATDAASTGYLMATAFEREAVQVAGGFVEDPIDADGDGLLDALRIGFDLDVLEAATYTIGLAIGPSGSPVVVQKDMTLAVGVQSVQLEVPGRRLFQRRMSGAFPLLGVSVDDATGARVTSVEPTFQTAPHDFLDFAHGAGYLDIGDVQSSVVHGTGDQGAAFLKAEIGLINPESAIPYSVRAALHDDQGHVVARSSGLVGPNAVATGRVAMYFPGSQIHQSGVNGPYRLSVSLLDKDDELIDVAESVHETAVYTATDFVKPPVGTVTVVGDHLEDTDADGQPDTLSIGVMVVPNATGSLALMGKLRAESGHVMDWSIADIAATDSQPVVTQLTFRTGRLDASGGTGAFKLTGLLAWDASDSAQFVQIGADYAPQSYTLAPLGGSPNMP